MEDDLQILKNKLDDMTITNEEKIKTMLENKDERSTLKKALNLQNKSLDINKLILKIVKIEKENEEPSIEISKEQIESILSVVGEISLIEQKSPNMYHIKFKKELEANVAKMGFDNLEFKEFGIKFQIHKSLKKNSVYSPIKWNKEIKEPVNLQENNLNYTHNAHNGGHKLTCRYDVIIENDKNFQVAKKIIGSGGCNMKNIIKKSTEGYYNKKDLLKLRLRGIGSGYKEGPEKKESGEPLHLCVSAKNQDVYEIACNGVERLLNEIFNDFVKYSKKRGYGEEDLEVYKFKKTESSNNH